MNRGQVDYQPVPIKYLVIPNRIRSEEQGWDNNDERLKKLYEYRLKRTKLPLALLELYRETFDAKYLQQAIHRAKQMVNLFEDKVHTLNAVQRSLSAG